MERQEQVMVVSDAVREIADTTRRLPTWIRLPYPISANRYWATRVVTPKGKRPMAITYVTEEAKAYRTEVANIVRAQGIACTSERIALRIGLYPHRPQDWAKRAAKNPDSWDDDVRCIDLGNCEKVLSDALNGVAWTDDKQMRRMVLDRMPPDEHGARVEIMIGRMTDI